MSNSFGTQPPRHGSPRLAILVALALTAACASKAKQAPLSKTSSTTQAEAAKQAKPVLHGKLVGHDGKPMPMAHVTIAGEATQVERDGSFRIELTEPGLVNASFTGVDHGDYTAKLLMEGGEVELLVKLGTYAAPTPLKELSVVEILFEDEGKISLGETTAMSGEKDGKHRATIKTKAGEFAYEIRGLAVDSGRSMNGTARTDFRYDGDGNYCNVVETDGGSLVVEVDPSTRNPVGVHTALAFSDEKSRTARIAAIFDPDSDVSLHTTAKMAQESDEVIRHAHAIALLARFSGAEGESEISSAWVELARSTLQDVPTSSPLWIAAPLSVTTMASMAGPEYAGHVEKLIEHFVSEEQTEIASQIAFGMLMDAARSGDNKTLRHYYTLINKEFADSSVAQIAKIFDPDRRIRLGNTIPAFALEDVDTKAELNNQSFAGKVLLIDFWATWCKPCMEEMPNLHATYQEFHDKGLEILSINVDDKPGRAQGMRKEGKFPMPWANVVLDAREGAEMKREFEVFGLPTMILVGRDGKVVAPEMALRGPGLREQVAAALASSAKAQKW